MCFLFCKWFPMTYSFVLSASWIYIAECSSSFRQAFSVSKPSSDIRFDMRTAIAREYCVQSLLSCPDLTVCDSVSKIPQGILYVTVFIETITLLNSVAKVAQIFEIAQLPGCCSVERNEMPCLNQKFREVETCRLPIHNGNELPCC